MVLTLYVKHGPSTHQLTETEDAGVSKLMQDIEELTGVPARHQKLICQGKVLDTAATLKEWIKADVDDLRKPDTGSTSTVKCVNPHTQVDMLCPAIGTSSSPTSDQG